MSNIVWNDLKDGWPDFRIYGFHTGRLVHFKCEDGTEHTDVYQGYGMFGRCNQGFGRTDVVAWAPADEKCVE